MPRTNIRNRATPEIIMKFLYLLICAVILPAASMAKLNVVATTSDFGAIAREIGGDRIEVQVLARPTEDPHFVDAKPSYIMKLNRADAVIQGGAELEAGWLPPLLEGARNANILSGAPGHIACAQGIELLNVPATLDRSKGDIHALGNPHFMVDPENGRRVAVRICDALCELDAASCDYYRENLSAFTDKIDAKLKEWQEVLAPYRGTKIVAYHDTWIYFGNRFGITADLFLEPKPGIPPTPSQIALVMKRMKDENIRVILCESYQNRKTAETVAKQTGATVVDVTQFPGGIKNVSDDYIGMIDYLVHAIASALAGTASP
jgi:zinc/manganese transport system substrate-binding protein